MGDATHRRGCGRQGERTSVVLPSHRYCPECRRMVAGAEEEDDDG